MNSRLDRYKSISSMFYRNLLFNWVRITFKRCDVTYWIVVVIWFIECVVLFEYLFLEYWRSNIIFLFNTPAILVLITIYWFLLWGMAVWRRSQFGRFTRGDRTLWAKGYASFWIAELVTVMSFILIYCWLSWGPMVFVQRYFLMPRKGLILEFICYTYLFFLIYFTKFSIRWNSWLFQFIISLFILILISYLLWRDIIILITKDSVIGSRGSKWRDIKLNMLVYSFSHEWWITHMLGERVGLYKYLSLKSVSRTKTGPLTTFNILVEHESRLFLGRFKKNVRINNLYFLMKYLIDIDWYYAEFNAINRGSIFYPRRVGFIPKRIAFWEFLMFLKIWHQLIILLWWLLYIFKLSTTKFSSYQLLAVCSFNIYCCYILSLLIYFISYFVVLENLLRFRPDVISFNRFLLFLNLMFDNIKQLLIVSNTTCIRTILIKQIIKHKQTDHSFSLTEMGVALL